MQEEFIKKIIPDIFLTDSPSGYDKNVNDVITNIATNTSTAKNNILIVFFILFTSFLCKDFLPRLYYNKVNKNLYEYNRTRKNYSFT